MGNPPHRPPACSGRQLACGGGVMRKLRRPAIARPRRRQMPRHMRRIVLLRDREALLAGDREGAMLSGWSPARTSAAMLSATGALGLTVDDIEVVGRTTTDT